MKKIILALDSFKGSVSAITACEALQIGISAEMPDLDFCLLPLSDGGEGLIESLEGFDGMLKVTLDVHDPLGRTIQATYLIQPATRTAIIEMATAAGLTLLTSDERNPEETSTYGVGELILDALKKDCCHILLGIGGCATNDGGMGLLEALGFRFLNQSGEALRGIGKNLNRIASIDDSKVSAAVKSCSFEVACDVNNPLYGKQGAAFVFAPQKGANPQMVGRLDDGLRHFASQIVRYNGITIASIPGAGAAGGLGGGLVGLLHAKLKPGIELLLNLLQFDSLLRDASLVITGAGKMDRQTLMGKVPLGVLVQSKKRNVPVIGVAGRVENRDELLEAGFEALFEVSPRTKELKQMMLETETISNLIRTTQSDAFRTCLKQILCTESRPET